MRPYFLVLGYLKFYCTLEVLCTLVTRNDLQLYARTHRRAAMYPVTPDTHFGAQNFHTCFNKVMNLKQNSPLRRISNYLSQDWKQQSQLY